jgi:SAM-dependent methyltransferase
MQAMPSRCSDSLDWLQTPLGRYLLEVEQQWLDHWVGDVFGFRAIQLGLPPLRGLRSNRMPSRWIVSENAHSALTQNLSDQADVQNGFQTQVLTQFHALPFPSASLDLLVLPHTLEISADPHAVLREVDRVLIPEGRVIILGFHHWSLWGLACRRWPWRQRIAYTRLLDWLRLLNFDLQMSQFRAFCPPIQSDRWLKRFAWLDHWGCRWTPYLGGIYAVEAIKRVHGMRLIELAKHQSLRRPNTLGLVTTPVSPLLHPSPPNNVKQ